MSGGAAMQQRLGESALPWFRRRLSAFDLETTGADPLKARIVSAAVAHVGGGAPAETRTWLVDPGEPIPAEASAIHGIFDADVKAKGRPTELAVPEIVDELVAAWARGEPVVIMNCTYDLTVLAMEARRTALGKTYEIGPVIDPYVLDKAVDPYRKGSRKLEALCAHYDARIDGAHDAAYDALAAARVAFRIAQRHREIGEAPLDVLQELQTGRYAAQTRSLDAYFKKNGKAGVDNFDWPVRALPPVGPATQPQPEPRK